MKRTSGFTLAEIAVVILIIGLLATMGMKMNLALLENTAYTETKGKQDRIKLALIAFLRANGRLPCPDNKAATDGVESNPCSASQNEGYGVVPYQALGLSRRDALDGWGNFFTYRVATASFPAANGPTPVHKYGNQNWTVKTAFDILSLASPLGAGFQTLLIQAATPESRTAVVVILSHGKNGFGAAKTNSPTRIPVPAPPEAGPDEQANATVGTTTFVRSDYRDAAAPGGAYDDVLAYMAPQDLLQPLISEGSLKACLSYCASPASGCAAAGIPVGNPNITCP